MKTIDIYILDDGTIVECLNCGLKDVRERFKKNHDDGQGCPGCGSAAVKKYGKKKSSNPARG